MSPDDHAHDNSHGHPHASIEDAPLGYYARMQEAVQELLIESGIRRLSGECRLKDQRYIANVQSR